MNKVTKIVIVGLLCSSQLFASHSGCFRNYNVTVTNHSGGIADFKSTKGVRGASRKTELENDQSLRLLITQRGAEIAVKVGPEGKKKIEKVKFFEQNHNNYHPSVIFNPKGFIADGFSQKEVVFPIVIDNKSGGIARIVDSCDATGKGKAIADGKSTRITVKPSGYIVVLAGPEKEKYKSKIVVVGQTGNNPTISLNKRSFFTRFVQSRGLEIQALRCPIARFRKRLEGKVKNIADNKVSTITTAAATASRRSRRLHRS